MASKPRWYFDFVSPFSYLQWRKLAAHADEFGIVPVPVVFGAILNELGIRGPAEIPHKREFTYRNVVWRARQEGIPFRFPPMHPFNPLATLRLCIAAGSTPEAVSAIFDWIWAEGRAADSAEAIAPLAAQLGVATEAIGSNAVKTALRDNTAEATAAGIFGVPTLAIGDDLIWGNDAHDLAMAALRDPTLFDDAEMRRVSTLPVGIRRA
ncbi:2-hydroxychromene-2-carboxylate isomerase [Luteimonas panaciterrae]|uniref:2-hydroxychromene-2-carboxylate isomerase n=1 Tax=Luteimonas panaciterrae TaxID=363885 RepID=UPI001CF955C1|nr:2-hydroxychromene-2-carboxylate isomerase [Luteimonas panaciterrae]